MIKFVTPPNNNFFYTYYIVRILFRLKIIFCSLWGLRDLIIPLKKMRLSLDEISSTNKIVT
jgi:hypothetical protein